MLKTIVITVVIVLIIGVMAGYFISQSCAAGKPAPPVQTPSPTAKPASPAPTIKSSLSPSPTVSAPPVSTAPPPVSPPAPATTPAPANVQFSVGVTEITGTGLSRTVTAQVANTGTADAHNTWAKVEVFSSGSRVKVGGNDFIKVDIGTLAAGTTIIKQVVLQFGLFDAPRLIQNGVQVALTITSDEATQTIRYDYMP